MAAAPPTPETGNNPLAISGDENKESVSWLMPPNTTGVAMGVICWPINATSGEPAATGAISGTPVTAGLGRVGFHSVAASCANETGRGSFDFCVSLPVPFSKMSSISLIGVIQEIGHLENGKLKAIAPTSRPSM